MAEYLIQDTTLVALGDKIRGKTGVKTDLTPDGTMLTELDKMADVSKDTVTASSMLSGVTAHNSSCAPVTGNIVSRTSSDLSASGATVTVPAGHYASQVTKSVSTATRANTTITITADDTYDRLTITASNNQSTGYVTGSNKTASTTISLTASGSTVTVSDGTNSISKSVATTTQATPSISVSTAGLITASATQSAGYVSAGTKSNTKQLTTQAAKTVTPSTSSQTAVESGVYTTGAITVAAMPTATQATPSISVDTSGLITASATQTAGYVSAGTKSNTKQLTTKAAATITPGTSNQTISSGTYLIGTQTISGDANLVASNIKKDVSIFGVTGTLGQVATGTVTVGGTDKTVTCNFKPDVVFFTGIIPPASYNTPIHAGVAFTETGNTSMTTYICGSSTTYVLTSLIVTQTSTGFKVRGTRVNASMQSSNESNRSLSYIAIKYT